MLSAKEKRFLKYWEEQKTGGKWQYIIVYTIGWAFILFFMPLTISFLINMYTAFRIYTLPLWAAIALSVAIGFALSQFMWHKNEEKEKDLLQKEKQTNP